jgi:preprotein translocase subunit SecA
VLDFDDVMNMQREVVYGYRNEVLTTEVPRALVTEIIEETIPAKVKEYSPSATTTRPTTRSCSTG